MDFRTIAWSELDPQQRELVSLPAGASAIVVGAPGTGKTEVLTQRVARLLRDGIDPAQILVLTPTRQTATALREQLAPDLDLATPGPLARSVASFAFQLVRAAAVRWEEPPPRLLTAADQDHILMDLLEGDERDADAGRPRWPETLGTTVRRSREFRSELRAFAAQCAELGVAPHELSALARELPHPVWESTASFLDEYAYVLGRLREAHRDPAQLLKDAAEALAQFGSALTAVRVLMVDDAQELTHGGMAVLEAARAAGIAVFAVGDPDIGSGAFRGAGAQTFARLLRLLGPPRALLSPHRSSPALTDIARRVTQAIGSSGVVAHRRPPSPDAGCGKAGDVVCAVEASPHEEVDRVALQLRTWHLHDEIPWQDMAVIVHDTSQVARLETELAAREVPTRAESVARPLGSEGVVREILAMVSLGITDPAERTGEQLSAALTGTFGGMDAVAMRRLRARLRTHEFTRDGARSALELLTAAFLEPATFVLVDTPEARRAARVARTLDEVHRQAVAGASAHELLWTVWERSGLAAAWQRRAAGSGPDAAEAERSLDALVALFGAAKLAAERGDESPDRFVRGILDSEIHEDNITRTARTAAVAILTPAAALGREFDAVVIANVHEGVWPNTRLRGGLLDGWRLADDVQARREGRRAPETAIVDRRRQVLHDELRLFLRALTRARSRVLVTSVLDDDTSPSVIFSFLPDPEPRTDRVPMTLRGAVARFRRVLTTSDDEHERREAAQQLAVLAREGVPGADPAQWYGVRGRTGGSRIHDLDDGPVPLSPSRLESFEACGIDWAVRALGGDTRTFSAGVGTILHAAMEQARTDPDLDVDAFIDGRWGELEFEAEWMSRQERLWAAVLGRRLRAYLAAVGDHGGEAIGAETRFRLRVAQDGPDGPPRVRLAGSDASEPDAADIAVINGSIDRLERYPHGRGEAVPHTDDPHKDALVVVDLKTGRSETRVSAEKVGDDAQLAAYQLAARALSDETAEVAGARLVVLSKTLKGTHYRIAHQAPMDDQQRDAFLRRVVADARAMAADAFIGHPDTHCNDDHFAVCRVHTVKPVSSS
ncbi:ATP-dependent DNA helicase [Microbacterium sediminicola]|uniref:DNA 3'-5' helicase n=1 Tax=Microbacterium sediminicola TaxID=415210 RepID=A0ABN2HMZ9_9MICO